MFEKPPSHLTLVVLKALSTLRLVKVGTNAETDQVETTNLTILNVFLVNLGPMKEDSLVKVLISTQVSLHVVFLRCPNNVHWCATQVAGSVLAFAVRYGLAWLLYDGNRR